VLKGRKGQGFVCLPLPPKNMGCCESIPDAPEEIIPDPGEVEQCTFSVASMGMMSNDYVVYKGSESGDKNLRWFFLNKTGSMWNSGATVELENFVRGENEDKPNQGQVLWTATFDQSPTFEKQFKSPSSDYTRFISNFGGPDFDGEEPGDEVYFQQVPGMNDGGYRRVMKWSLRTTCQIAPGTRGQAYAPGFELKVFSRGTSIADYDKHHDDERGTYYTKQEAEFVDELAFQLIQLNNNTVIATWAVPGDLVTGGGEIGMTNPLFSCQMRGGWVSSNPLIETGEFWDPTLALMVAYLCAYEYSPKEIKEDLNSDFPENPNAFPGWSGNF